MLEQLIIFIDSEAFGYQHSPRFCVWTPFKQATAQRIAQEELESQAQEDAILALRLTAWEEAERERELARARRRSRRQAQATLPNAATAAAVARQGDVSEAVRILQYQEIDENDFEVLLELDEDGPGAGTGLCGKGRGLSDEAVEASLRHEIAGASRLSDTCVICMMSYELGDEVSQHSHPRSCDGSPCAPIFIWFWTLASST